jgi:type IV secretion system protein VirB10
MAGTAGAESAAQSGHAPVLVVDFSHGSAAPDSGPAAATPGKTSSTSTEAGTGLNADERFLARIEGGPEPAKASATMLRNQNTLIPQGATIPAVLETALNSDLPGYARAVVSRDVLSFDASTVLIPRGSRVIGEYRSAVAQGQRRAFVVWTRVLRPDGASIMIGSGGGDTLGRAGLGGKVDTHFLEEFGGAVLLTVLNAGANAVAGVPSTEVVIGSASASAAGNLAGPLSALAPVAIPPTIKVAQGTPVLIFVQRDLDFSHVESGAK